MHGHSRLDGGATRQAADVRLDDKPVVSPDGEWLGQVETPPRFRILDVTEVLSFQHSCVTIAFDQIAGP